MGGASLYKNKTMWSLVFVLVTMVDNVYNSVSHFGYKQEHCYLDYKIRFEESCHEVLDQV